MEEKINNPDNSNQKERIVSSPLNEKNIKKRDKWLPNIGKFINFGNIFFGLLVGVIATCGFIKDFFRRLLFEYQLELYKQDIKE